MAKLAAARARAPGWATVFQAAPVGIAITSGPDDVYTYVNDEYLRLDGRAAQAIIGKPLRSIARSPAAAGFAVLAQRLRAERTGYSRRAVRVPFDDGPDMYVDVQFEPLVTAGGTVDQILHIVVDVTARVHAEERLDALTLQRGAVLDQMTSGVVTMDREGHLTFQNHAALKIHGMAALELRDSEGRRVPPEQSPLSRALRGERVSEDYAIRRADGEERWLSYSAGPVLNAGGDIVGAVGTFADRTTERKLRAAVATSEDRLRRVYESVGCGILVRGPDGRILFANDEAGRLFGVAAESLIGMLHAGGVRRFAEDGSELQPADVPARAVLRSVQPQRDVRTRVVRSDGSSVWARVDAVPVLAADGTVEYVVSSFVDITERKRAEERLALRARQQTAIAELGRRSLATNELETLFADAVATLNGLLGADVSRILEHDPASRRLSVRAGQRLTGAGELRGISDEPAGSQAGYTMAADADIVANDLANERRFAVYQPIIDAGYKSTATVIIRGHDRPFGMIAVLSRSLEFAADDVLFIRAIANVLGEAIERASAFNRLRANEERLRTIVANLPIDLMVYDAAGRVTLTAGRRTSPSVSARATDESVFDRNRQNPAGLNRIVRALRGEEIAEEVESNGRTIDMRHHPVLDDGGKVTEVIGLAIDVTDRARAEADVARKEAFVRSIFESVDTHIAVLDRKGIVVDANGGWLEHAGSADGDLKDALIGDDYLAVCRRREGDEARQAAAGIDAVLDGRHPSFTMEFPTDRNGGRRWYHMFVLPMRSADGGVVISHRDVTERRRVQDALEHQTLHDALTDLPNRVLLRDRLRQAILAARRRNNLVALLFIDLDRFKDLNDTFGHQAGDIVLREVGERFRAAVRGSDTVARLGGDEFAVLVPVAADVEEALLVASRVVTALQEPFVIEGESTFIEASIGVVLSPEHGEDVQTLMRRADVAMYAAKRSGEGIQLYEAEKDLHSPSAIGLAGDLRHSVERGELVLHYQPIVDLTAGRCVGVEALCRWQHPARGLISPAVFIPLAEETGFIKQIGNWTIAEALRVVRDWRVPGDAPRVSVNLSMRNLRGGELPAALAAMIERSSANPAKLKIEITESAMMADAEHTLEVLRELQRMGIRLSVDDFGTGYSSLAYLQRLPVDDIKVDRSFVLNMLKNTSDEAIVRSTIELAHNLGLRAIAEGVEDQATLDRLRALGCDEAQGYHIGRPMPMEELVAWLAASPWGMTAG